MPIADREKFPGRGGGGRFESFHSSGPRGLGLGLYISKNIVDKHGGGIDIDSRAGEGATFTVWLPI